MAHQPPTDRDWKTEATAGRAKAEHLQAAVDRLRSLAVAGEAAGFLAHELNNLFTPVVGYCHAAQDERADDAMKAKALQKALAAAERVGEVSRAILGLAGSVGGESNQRGEADVAACVEAGLLVLGAERWGREGIKVKVDVPRGTLVGAAPGVVQQVVMNLVLNARRAMAGRTGRLGIWAREVGGVVRMEVRDEGVGMDAEVMGRSLGITSSDDDGRGDQMKVDVDELARSGSINGQARWGVRLREVAKEQLAKLPKSEAAAVEKNLSRLRGAKVAASMSPIRVWDAKEVAEELRGEGSRDQGIQGREDGKHEGGGGNTELRRGTEGAEGKSVGAGEGYGLRVGTTVVATSNGDARTTVEGPELGEASGSPAHNAPITGGTGDRWHGGTGLGLALCLELVGRVGGTIGAQSKVGEGTVVRVEWPRVRGASRRAA